MGWYCRQPSLLGLAHLIITVIAGLFCSPKFPLWPPRLCTCPPGYHILLTYSFCLCLEALSNILLNFLCWLCPYPWLSLPPNLRFFLLLGPQIPSFPLFLTFMYTSPLTKTFNSFLFSRFLLCKWTQRLSAGLATLFVHTLTSALLSTYPSQASLWSCESSDTSTRYRLLPSTRESSLGR